MDMEQENTLDPLVELEQIAADAAALTERLTEALDAIQGALEEISRGAA